MLKLRIITGVILVTLTLIAIFFLPSPLFCFVTALLAIAAAGEWTNLMELRRFREKFLYLLCIVIIFLLALVVSIRLILISAFIWWLIATCLIILYPKGSSWWGKGIFWRGVMGIMVLLPCWVSLNYIRNQGAGPYDLLFMLVLVWGADTFAYFGGRAFGKTKLAPFVSPGKTWEGFFSAILGSLAIALFALWLCDVPIEVWPWGIGLSFITVVFSVIGDLFESMLKRHAGVKDSGKLLPGHGGILDRIDSLTAAAPIFALGIEIVAMYLT